MQAEIPQPISATPMRWGGVTTPQLGWIAVGASVPYALLRFHLGAAPTLVASAPWLAAALLLAVGRREGRRLDLWVLDWLAFQIQPHRLRHPGASSLGRDGAYVEVDPGGLGAASTPLEASPALPWVAR